MVLNNRKMYLVIALSFTFILSRLLFLDCDLPPGSLTKYWSHDEMFYTIPAFNLYNYGNMMHQVVDWVSDDMLIINNSMLGNIMAYFSLKIFGNNYYGLRFPAVLASFVVVVLLLKLLWVQVVFKGEKKKIYRVAKITFLVVAFFVIIDFPFMMASRVYENTIFKMMAMMILLYLATIYFSDKRTVRLSELFLFGFLAGSGVWFVYFTNIFFLPAFGLFVLAQGVKKGWRNGALYLCLYCIGIFASIIFHSVVYYAIYDQFYWKEMLGYFNDANWGGRRINVIGKLSTYALLKSILINVMFFFETNIFLLNPVMRALFLCSIPVFIYKIIRSQNNFHILVGILLLFLFVQSMFLNDFHQRKLIILFPLAVIIIFSAIIEVIIMVDNKKLFFNVIKKINLINYLIFGTLIAFAFLKDFGENSYGEIISVFNGYLIGRYAFIHISITLLLLLLYILMRKQNIRKLCLLIFLLLLFIPELYYDYNYIYKKPAFNHRDAMKKVALSLDGKKGVGASLGMRLYNESIVYYNTYKHAYKNEEKYKNDIEVLFNNGEIDFTHIKMSVPGPKDSVHQKFLQWHVNLGLKLFEVYDLPGSGKTGLFKRG